MEGGRGHLWETSRPEYQAWEGTGHKRSTYYALGKFPPVKKLFLGVNGVIVAVMTGTRAGNPAT